jgi:hypothetical protein
MYVLPFHIFEFHSDADRYTFVWPRYIPPRRPQTDFLRWLWPAAKQNPMAVTETEFRLALDGYNGAEMRFGT